MITDNDVNVLRSLIMQYEAAMEAADRADYLSDTDDPVEAEKWSQVREDKMNDALSLVIDINDLVDRMCKDQPQLTEAVMKHHNIWNVWRPNAQ